MSSTGTRTFGRHAVVAGAGLGGLAAAVGLRRRGWTVTVVERAPELRPVGAGLAVAVNGLRALDAIGGGVGDTIRALASIQGDAAVRKPDGTVLARTSGEAIAKRFGEPVVLAPRAAVLEALAGQLEGTFQLGVSATGIDAEGAVLHTSGGDVAADLVIVADGVNSVLRDVLFPGHPAPRYSGFTAWRMLVPRPVHPVVPGETWGGTRVFGTMPLADGRVYAYAADRSEPGVTYPDVQAELLRRFGSWHDPIPELLWSARQADILHNDVYEAAEPLPAYHVGNAAILGDAAHAMTPHLGQGGNQAFEDAATLVALVGAAGSAEDVRAGLAEYSALRVPRGADIVRRSHKAGDLTQTSSRAKAWVRDAGMRVAGRLVPDLALRAMDPVATWQPPVGV